jgi:hypothetical protein
MVEVPAASSREREHSGVLSRPSFKLRLDERFPSRQDGFQDVLPYREFVLRLKPIVDCPISSLDRDAAIVVLESCLRSLSRAWLVEEWLRAEDEALFS